jgi:hypothetical protein
MSEERSRKRRRFWGSRRWHRYLGAVFALPLLWLCITGLLLQHQDDLGLDERRVKSEWLLKQYDQIPEGEPQLAKAGRFTVAEWGGVLFLGGKILEESGTLVGVVAKPAELVVATSEEVFVYDAQGTYLDRLGEESLPGVPIEKVGLDDAGRVVLEIDGERHALSDDVLVHEAVSENGAVSWSVIKTGGAERGALQEALVEGAGFTWSRVITDLHSGSLLGKLGRLMVDLTGVAVIVLTLFGIRLVFKRT